MSSKTCAPPPISRWGKRSASLEEDEAELEGGPALMRQLRAASPLRWGKRGRAADQDKRAPLRWGKRMPSR